MESSSMKRDLKILQTIVRYCDDVLEDVEYYGNDEESYLENPRYQRSTSFSISQIGEMVKRLSPELRSNNPDVDWKGISGTRDVIVHGYEYIRLSSMWETIDVEIPKLKVRCEEIISGLERMISDE